MAVGFTAPVLLDGAGVAQFMSDLREKDMWPKGTGPWLLPRRWDRPEDRVSIALGVKLFKQMPVNITAQVLVKAVISTNGLLKMSAGAVREDVKRGVGVPERRG